MEKLDPDETLVAFALATFQSGLLILVAVLALHLGGALGNLLSELSTTIGLGSFVALWLTTCFCTYRAVHEVELRHDGMPLGKFVIAGIAWGCRNGLLLLFELLVAWAAVFYAKSLLANELGQAAPTAIFFGFLAVFGGIVAASIGAMLGLIAGGLSAVLWALANSLAVTGHESVSVTVPLSERN